MNTEIVRRGSLAGASGLSDGEHHLRLLRLQSEAALGHVRINLAMAVYDTREQMKRAFPERARGLDLIARLGGVR